MFSALKELIKQPYWVIALIVGAVLIALPSVDVDKNHFSTHPPSTSWPVITGLVVLSLSAFGFAFTLWSQRVRNVGAGLGRCVLLINPLGRSVPIALVSTTTQRAGEGLSARISYLFDGMRELVTRLADARLNEVAMPVLGAGHGGVDPPLALVGLLLAVAEAARYGRGAQRLKKVNIIVFRPDADSPAEVNPVVIRRALPL